MSSFLILGISNGGLFLARQLRKQWPGATIYAVGNPDDIGQYSKTIDGFYPAFCEDEVLDRINEVIEVSNGGRVKAFMCSNPMLEFVVLHHPELFERLDFENSYDLYRRLVDKSEVDKLCRSLRMNRPEEYELNDLDDSGIRFPVVVKPLEKTRTIGASKCAYLNTRGELKAYMEKMSRMNIDPKVLVCQQLVKGDNRWEYGYGGYFKDGKPIVDIIFHQFIQVPQGLCCYTREMANPSLRGLIMDVVRPFMEETRYNGFLEFDIKQDRDSKELYVLDVNPRPWRSVDMLSGKLSYSTVFSPIISDEKVVWRYRFRELFRKRNRKNVSYKLCKLLTDSNYVCCTALYDRMDTKPFLIQRRNDWRGLWMLLLNKIKG